MQLVKLSPFFPVSVVSKKNVLKAPGRVDAERFRLLVPKENPAQSPIKADNPPIPVVGMEPHPGVAHPLLFHRKPLRGLEPPVRLEREDEHVLILGRFVLVCNGNTVELAKCVAIRRCRDDGDVLLALDLFEHFNSLELVKVLS